jgi:sugar lactone lactonase YvrE
MKAAQHTEPLAFHAEGPVWWPDDGSALANSLRWVDLTRGRVLTLTAAGVSHADVGGPVAAFLRPRAGGGAAVVTEHGLSLSRDPALSDLRPALSVLDDPGVRFNEGGASPTGSLLCGSMRYDQAHGGAVLLEVTPELEVRTVRRGLTVSNGIDWSPDGTLAYHNDTPARRTTVSPWDPETGLGEPRTLFALDERDGAVGPDGLCVDSEGRVWTAIYGGSRVECREPSGRLAEVVELPVTNVTACAFGGERLDELFITTTRENVPAGSQPQAGAVFTVKPGAVGRPVRPFAG